MKYYFFNQKINTDTVNELVDRLQDIEGKISLFFSTNGGQLDSMRYLISFLNSRKKDITITLTDRLVSAGTLLLTDFEGEIVINEGLDFILFHMWDRESYSLRVDITISDKILTKQDKAGNLFFAEKLKNKKLLNDKQIKQFLQGKDVVLYKDTFSKWKYKQEIKY